MANALTITRLALIPVFLFFYFSPLRCGRSLAILVFAAAALTDALDGLVARRSKTVTEFGKKADPLADKLLGLAVFISLVMTKELPLWGAIVLVARDSCLVIGSLWMIKKTGSIVRVSVWGKLTTIFLVATLGLALLGFRSISYYFLFPTLAFAFVSMALYLAEAVRRIRAKGRGGK